jgi:hypothetical protein
VPDTGTGGLYGATTYHWTQIANIKRDPFEQTVGADAKSLLGYAGSIGSPSTAYLYDWNILPIGQLLWTKELMSYKEFPPMQAPFCRRTGSLPTMEIRIRKKWALSESTLNSRCSRCSTAL